VLRIPLRGTRLRRAVDPGDLCQPSGPDGEGQARGQACNARGEPPRGNPGTYDVAGRGRSDSIREAIGHILNRANA